ncbi:putative U-box domain-containing protein 50 [Sesamum indicum]|uniref:RING-type E3 ubiquitin transferase n=1 Tax=Sesamum indicum TaxID=4182 RepID=A0A6I9UNM2_SESIN|nr:putative U-box domain-containing protein 50 [Sesamum indicum]
MENIPTEKVYVAIGTDWGDGFSTLQWTLRKWSNHGISIVILHAANTICKDYVYTPLGRLPSSSVSEEKLMVLEKSEEAKSDKILSQYIAFCGRVKAEVIKLENNDQPLHKQIVEVISSLRITKLVMSLAFMKLSSWKSRTVISGTFYVLRQKPDFCNLFVICGGRLVFLREENEQGFIEDDRGMMVAKLRKNHSIKTWFGKTCLENAANNSSPSSSGINDSAHQWEKWSQEIEQYANELLSIHEAEEGKIDLDTGIFKERPTELYMPENMDAAERIQFLKRRIQTAQHTIQLKKQQAHAAKKQREKAEWAISICNSKAEELEASINEEVVKNIDLNKELDSRKRELNELGSEVEEKRSKLNSILELQKELSQKLQLSTSAKARAEVQLEKAVRTRAEMVQEIEELRKNRDVLQRRIEFCKEKDAIAKVSKSYGFGSDYREFSAAEIKAATEDFSQRLRLKSVGRLTNVYRGRINHITVAIKTYSSEHTWSKEGFTTMVKLLSQVRHPNLLAMIGFCSELNCIVYEYMHNGSLNDALHSTETSSRSLSWHARIRIAAEISSALGFLHKVKPMPIIHGNLKPSNILLDRNNVARINSLMAASSSDIKSDIQAFGNLVLQLLTGKNWTAAMDTATAVDELDHSAGRWPMVLAMELYSIAVRCFDESIAAMPTSEVNNVKQRADELVTNCEFPAPIEMSIYVDDLSNVPSAFLCPIYQDVMQNPHLASDGYSYELKAIDEWLKTGHDTSPMTNLRLKHKLLIPNHNLRSLIQDWQNKRSA